MSDEIEVVGVAPEGPHSAALYEAGKALLVESVQIGREFCKFMVGVATGAIPTYLALVGLATGKNYRPDFMEGVLLLVPPALFLVAAGIFAYGYFPVRTEVSLELPDDIDRARKSNMDRRATCSLVGFIVFGIAVLGAVAGAAYALTIEVPPPPAGG
jgi:hypothetical protein